MRYKKTQEGMFIALFALATVVIIGILVSYMSNWVNDMIATQTQVFFGKQAYWNAHSGMEIATSKRIASLNGIPSSPDVSFATGKITITQGAPDANGYLGGNKVTSLTSTGNDLRGRSRAMKLEIGDPETGCNENVDGHSSETLCDAKAADHSDYITHWVSNACNEAIGAHSSESSCDAGAANHNDGTSNGTGHYLARNALFFDRNIGKYVDIGTIEEKMEMQLSCNDNVDGHSSETLCDAEPDAHSPTGTGQFNKIEYADDGAQADFSISLWLKPDYSAMPTFGVFFAVNNCVDAPPEQGCNNERGIVMGLTDDAPASLGELQIWHDGNLKDPTVFSDTEVSADIWNHVVYTRSAATPGEGVGTIYLNGVLLGTDNPDNSWFKDADEGELWHLGTDIDLGPVKTKNYAGGLDEVAIWRTALSLAQIQSLYIQGMSYDIDANMGTNLVAYWDFDGEGVDGSVNGFTATVTGAAYTGF